MYLKTLTLKGFKSFADSTTLDLEPGVTVVVGPNGSGKSNIVDAVAWVLGAQGAKTIRSNKMEDVIFAGSSKKAALGRAEVSLTIDNSDGTLPIDFSEVTITRTLFRTGESEYALNGVSCRLLDIQELLSDSGVGRQQHVIVSQGQLAAILDSRPEDRRGVIEEAAGVLKYRKRRERAQRRLESTEANFARLGDLLREVRRQLRPLERQAEAAKKHEEMSAELKAIRMHLSGRELSVLQVRTETSARTKHDLQVREKELRTQLASLDADVMFAESQLSAVGGGALAETVDDPFLGVDLGDALARVEALYARARGHLAFLGERRRGIERDRNSFLDRGVVEALSGEAAKLVAELEKVQNEALDLPTLFDDLQEKEGALSIEREHFLEDWGLETNPQPSAGPTVAEVRSELNSRRQAKDRTAADAQRLDARALSLQQRLERLVADAAKAEAEIDRLLELLGGDPASPSYTTTVGQDDSIATSEAAHATQQRVDAELALSEVESALEAIDERFRETDGAAKSWKARVDALTSALDAARARAGAQRLAGLDGIIGTLLDLVDVDSGWEAAFEAAIGEAMNAVVVRDSDAARRALSRLHESSTSGAVLALGALVGSGAVPTAASQNAGGSQPIRSHVRANDPSVSEVLDALLGNAVVVDGNWTAALDLALAHPELVVVTRTGDRFAGSGWRAGSGSSGATGAALAEAVEAAATSAATAAEARVAAETARAKVQQSRVQLKELRSTEQRLIAEHQKRVNQLAAEHQQRVNQLNSARNSLPRLANDRADVSAELSALSQQADEARARGVADSERVAELEAMLPMLVEAENELAIKQSKRREASQRLDQRTAAVAAIRRDLEVRAASIEERRRILVGRQTEIEDRLSRSVEERQMAEQRRIELDFLAEQTELLHVAVEDRAALLESGLADIRIRRRKQNEAARAATARLEGLRRSRGDAETQLSQVLERLQRVEIEAAEIRLRLETLVEQVRREFDAEPSIVMAAPCPPLANGTAPTTRVRDLERDLRLLGPINPLALDEFIALQERNALLEGQLDDVKTTRRDLAKVIRAIDEEIVTVFTAAFADVSENFTNLFQTLFPGGYGQIRMTDPENPLETGVEVEARPSGKNVRKLSLLSGGERSLVAMAFLFAVFRSRPSPFYLMDEVEAALDDVNLNRFIGLLNEFRQEAQLLVVSHQKRTMEAADCLYGVTMQVGGSSKVMSEKVGAAV